MGRSRSWWNGNVVGVGWSPWHSAKVPEIMIEVVSGGATPPHQRGRLVRCGMTPAKARALAAELIKRAEVAEQGQAQVLGDVEMG